MNYTEDTSDATIDRSGRLEHKKLLRVVAIRSTNITNDFLMLRLNQELYGEQAI